MCRWVAQAFVYGESLRSTLVGIIVPDHEVLLPWAKAEGLPTSIAELCKDERVRKMIFDDIVRLGKELKLHSFEQVKAVHLDHRQFTVENGLLVCMHIFCLHTVLHSLYSPLFGRRPRSSRSATRSRSSIKRTLIVCTSRWRADVTC